MWDGAKSEAIRRGLNLLLRDRYGELMSLQVDSKSRSLSMEVMLKGEQEAVAVRVGTYEWHGDEETPSLICREIRVSRPWMEELARAYGEGTPIRIPRQIAGLVKMVLF